MDKSESHEAIAGAVLATSQSTIIGPSGNNDKYYIWSSKAQKIPGTKGHSLVPGTIEDTFVASLTNGFIILVSEPIDSNLVVDLDSTDELVKWLSILNSKRKGGYKFSLEFDKLKNIKGFHFHLSKPWELTFSSTAKDLEFSFGPSASRIPAPGINETGTLLYCGLNESMPKPVDATIGEIASYAGLVSMLEYLPSTLLEVKVKLDAATAKHKRNAVWLNPLLSAETTARLQFQLDTLDALKKELDIIPHFNINEAYVVCKRVLGVMPSRTGPCPVNKGQVTFLAVCSITSMRLEMSVAISFLPSSITLAFLPTANSSKLPLMGIVSWIKDLAGVYLDVDTMLKDSNAFIGEGIILRRVTIGLDLGEGAHRRTKVSRFSVDIEVPAKLGRSPGSQQPVLFLISYSWIRGAGEMGSLQGRLWNSFAKGEDRDLSQYYEEWTELTPVTKNPTDRIKLLEIVPTGEKIENVPDYIPTDITEAYIYISSNTLAIGGAITAANLSPGDVPQPYLGQLRLNFTYTWKPTSAFTLQFGIRTGLQPSIASKHREPALLEGQLDYDSKARKWEVHAGIRGLYASCLLEFFDSVSAEHVLPLIDSIALDHLNLHYKYENIRSDGKSVGSWFHITGMLLISDLQLELDFLWNNGWSFTATLKSQEAKTNVGDIIKSILHNDQLDIPDFLANVPFKSKEGTLKISVRERKPSSLKSGTSTSFQFSAEIQMGPLSVTFVQYHENDWSKRVPSKRLLRVAFKPLGEKRIDIPLVGQLEPPLDEVDYIWIQDTTDLDKKSPGFNRKEIRNLQAAFSTGFVVNDRFENPTEKDVLISSGSHFMVVGNKPTGGKHCILDYCFKKSAEKKATIGVEDGNEANEGNSGQAPLKKKAGPLSIHNIGLKYSGKLRISFDATMKIGPLNFSLLGFGINIDLKTIDRVPAIVASLEGLSASYEKPPLTIAGIFRHGNKDGVDYYAGGLVIGFVPYEFQAAGFYGDAKGPPRFNSIFIFAKLNGPLVTLEFAEISGVTGGFGYKSQVTMPSVNKVVEFPFVSSDKISGGSALEALESLVTPGGWFRPLDDTYWVAAGLQVTACSMISLDAVVMVQFGKSIMLSIAAVATADIPTLKADAKFAHIELGILVMVDFDYGVLKAEAQLSPNSYVLHPDCHLTGGFGLYYWFDAPHSDQSKTGDFVFTLGGYHQAFDVPAGYPNPPRLGISWSLGRSLSITGQAYFAITPKACMGGGRLHASFSAGPIEAWFDVFADFLINYKPFHFIAKAGISVGVRIQIDILFISTSISVEIGADLTLWGPPVAGLIHVNFWITSFDIAFGGQEDKQYPLSLEKFYELVLQSSKKTGSQRHPSKVLAPSTSPNLPIKNEGHVFLAQSGLVNNSNNPERTQNETWLVRAGSFSCVVACKMAIKSATLNDKDTATTITSNHDVYSKPMKLQDPLNSHLTVTIEQDPDSFQEGEDKIGWCMSEYIKPVPRGLWEKYSRDTDPTGGRNHIEDLLNGDSSGIPMTMGVSLKAPPSIKSPDKFPAFDIQDTQLVKLPAEKPFPFAHPSHREWEPSAPITEPTVKEQWVEVHKYWKDPHLGEAAQEGFVTMFIDAFEWGSTLTKWKMPDRLEKQFYDLYVAAPLLTA